MASVCGGVTGETTNMQKDFFLILSPQNGAVKHRLTCSLGGISSENILSLDYFQYSKADSLASIGCKRKEDGEE